MTAPERGRLAAMPNRTFPIGSVAWVEPDQRTGPVQVTYPDGVTVTLRWDQAFGRVDVSPEYRRLKMRAFRRKVRAHARRA